LLKRIHFLEIKNPKRVFLLAWDPLHFIQFESSPTLFDEEPENFDFPINLMFACSMEIVEGGAEEWMDYFLEKKLTAKLV
ncbi:MAG: hypothetical protein LKJ03_03035, partial [Enterococcaceae bacterium]|nr:hypothetical protein [Enterococcaceae bacterium]